MWGGTVQPSSGQSSFRSFCSRGWRSRGPRLSSKIFLSCGLNSLHFSPKMCICWISSALRVPSKCLTLAAGFCPLLLHHEPHNSLFQVHEKVLPLLKPSSLLPQGLCICWSFIRNLPYTCLARSSLSCRAPHKCQVHSSKTDETPPPLCYSLLYHHVLFLHCTYHSFQS